MNVHHIRRLPVVDEDGKLVGIVSRRDLLSVFLRPDADITHDVRQVLDEIPVADPKDVIVTVHHGVVSLTGTMRPEPGDGHDLILLALPPDLGYRRRGRRREQARQDQSRQGGYHRLTTPRGDHDGVVDVVNGTTEGESPDQNGKSAPG
jgi:CBS domain-containing protein